MAVTVTKAAPSLSIDKIYIGSYGISDSAVSASVNAEAVANKRTRATKWTLSGTYVTGGFAIVPSDYGLKEIQGICVIGDTASTSGAGAVPRLTTTGSSPIVKLFMDTSTEFTSGGSVTSFVYAVQVI